MIISILSFGVVIVEWFRSTHMMFARVDHDEVQKEISKMKRKIHKYL